MRNRIVRPGCVGKDGLVAEGSVLKRRIKVKREEEERKNEGKMKRVFENIVSAFIESTSIDRARGKQSFRARRKKRFGRSSETCDTWFKGNEGEFFEQFITQNTAIV